MRSLGITNLDPIIDSSIRYCISRLRVCLMTSIRRKEHGRPARPPTYLLITLLDNFDSVHLRIVCAALRKGNRDRS